MQHGRFFRHTYTQRGTDKPLTHFSRASTSKYNRFIWRVFSPHITLSREILRSRNNCCVYFRSSFFLMNCEMSSPREANYYWIQDMCGEIWGPKGRRIWGAYEDCFCGVCKPRFEIFLWEDLIPHVCHILTAEITNYLPLKMFSSCKGWRKHLRTFFASRILSSYTYSASR